MKKLLMRVLRWVLLPVFLLAVGAGLSAYSIIGISQSANDNANWFDPETGIDEAFTTDIGGVNQFIRVRSQDRTNPVLLFLHGGPGISIRMVTYNLFKPWTEYFTLVEWDQRGAGYSEIDLSVLDGSMTIDQMVGDTVEVIDLLRERYGAEKVIVVGFSWGTVLGTYVAKTRPDLVHAYVGVGQATAFRAERDEAVRQVITMAQNVGDDVTVAALSELTVDWPGIDDKDAFVERVLAPLGYINTYGGQAHAYKDLNNTMNPLVFLGSPDVSILRMMKIDSIAINKPLIDDLYHMDLRKDLGDKFEVPMFFFQGKYDLMAPTSMVKEWAEKIDAPVVDYVSFERSSHGLFMDEPGKVLVSLVSKVRPHALVNEQR